MGKTYVEKPGACEVGTVGIRDVAALPRWSMRDRRAAAAALHDVREDIGKPGAWCQGTMEDWRDAHCILGQFEEERSRQVPRHDMKALALAEGYVQSEIKGSHGIVDFNDAWFRSQGQVVRELHRLEAELDPAHEPCLGIGRARGEEERLIALEPGGEGRRYGRDPRLDLTLAEIATPRPEDRYGEISPGTSHAVSGREVGAETLSRGEVEPGDAPGVVWREGVTPAPRLDGHELRGFTWGAHGSGLTREQRAAAFLTTAAGTVGAAVFAPLALLIVAGVAALAGGVYLGGPRVVAALEERRERQRCICPAPEVSTGEATGWGAPGEVDAPEPVEARRPRIRVASQRPTAEALGDVSAAGASGKSNVVGRLVERGAIRPTPHHDEVVEAEPLEELGEADDPEVEPRPQDVEPEQAADVLPGDVAYREPATLSEWAARLRPRRVRAVRVPEPERAPAELHPALTEGLARRSDGQLAAALPRAGFNRWSHDRLWAQVMNGAGVRRETVHEIDGVTYRG